MLRLLLQKAEYTDEDAHAGPRGWKKFVFGIFDLRNQLLDMEWALQGDQVVLGNMNLARVDDLGVLAD